MNTQEKINVFKELFLNNFNMYAVQKIQDGKSYYIIKRESLTDNIIYQHLKAEITLGTYSLNGKTRWLCVDIDSRVVGEIEDVLLKAKELKIPAYLEDSGNKGFHVWVFFNGFFENKKARELGFKLTGKHEIFPKQDVTSNHAPGSLIKLPFGVHQVTGNRCFFLDDGFMVYEKQFEFLRTVKKVNVNEFICQDKELPIEVIDNSFQIRMIKPCIEKVMREGVEKGKRNHVGHIIASELRRICNNKDIVWSMLLAWNMRCRPGLDENELKIILSSVFSSKIYNYGCSPKGALCQVLSCVGRCRYFKQVRQTKQETKDKKKGDSDDSDLLKKIN